ncbi:hypothetical protein ABT084_03995 [Streptomyces sp. NPDC002138]|uniref:hypothetical protein n=1 Tax=Streptomyces sp. NPDC002138 TaxID=3154410 RepID=UPI0033217C14
MAAELPGVRLQSDLFTGPLVKLWDVLFDLSEQVPDAWSLIGGQMVLLHGLEHGRTPPAASADLDVLADVQSYQQSLRRLVAALERLGFSPADMSPQGNLLHRYQRGVGAGGTRSCRDRSSESRHSVKRGRRFMLGLCEL